MITIVKIATIMSIMTKRGGTVMAASGKIVLATEEKQIDNLMHYLQTDTESLLV